MKDELDKQEFHDLMSIYRTWPMTDQEGVVRAFEEVKKYIRNLRK